MDLRNCERLTKEKGSILESKNIYFAGFSLANIQYFLECFPALAKNIKGVFAVLDIDERTPKKAAVGAIEYKIEALENVKSLSYAHDVLIIMYEYEREAYDKILEIREDNPLSIYWFADKATEMELSYRDKYEDSVSKDVIIFKSGSRKYVYGEDFSDNSRALFEYMLKNGYNKKWKLVWLVFHPDNEEYEAWKKHENVEFIGAEDKDSKDEEKRATYYKNLCAAKIAFVTDDEIFFRRRRPDQILVQLWHGDGVKGRTRFRVMEKRWEYMACTSHFYAESDQEVFGLRADQTLPCGLPKDDWIISEEAVTKSYKESLEGFEHCVLWAPTFRKSVKGLEILNENVEINETGLPVLATWEACDQLNEKLRKVNCLLIIKLHPVADLSIHEGRSYSNIRLLTNQELFSMGLHINQIMPLFDAFISDYSSAVTSYMALDRPMAFTLDDLDEYDDSRGFVLNPVKDYLPGEFLYTVEDMKKFISDVCAGSDATVNKRHELMDLMLDYYDGRNSERLLEKLGIEK